MPELPHSRGRPLAVRRRATPCDERGTRHGRQGGFGVALRQLPCRGNPPVSYGANAPPGAPHWSLPPAAHKMAWIGLPPDMLCSMIKDRASNGERDFAALIKHVSEDKLVLWGWNPGGDRAP